MTRGEEETSTSQAGRKRGPARGTRSASSIVSSLAMEELRTYCEILYNIDLKLMEETDKSTMGGEYNAVFFFTREQLATGLRFPVPARIKQFLHFTRAPPALIHPNTIRILTGCSVLNLLYQLDLSVEVCFIYALMVGQGGRLSMSIWNASLQIVNGLLDSPKMEAKGALLVRGPWDETPSSLGLPFRVNRL